MSVKVDKEQVLLFPTKPDSVYVLKKQGMPASAPLSYPGKRNNQPKKYGEAMLGKECTFR